MRHNTICADKEYERQWLGLLSHRISWKMSAESLATEVTVSRPIYRLDEINKTLCYENEEPSPVKKLAKKLNSFDCAKCLQSVFPFLGWIREYSARRDLPLDIISGCTVAIMHIPQGMGYALLANIPPIMGIYTAFFPVLMFFLFGSSRHNSMGTFAVVSIMVGKSVLAQSSLQHIGPDGELLDESAAHLPSAIEVVTALCFLIGVIQTVLCLLRMGIVATLLSDALVSGFTTGAAIHVFTSQVKDLFGLTLPKFPGNFDVLLTYYEIFKNIAKLNHVATALSVVTCIVLILNNELLKPRVAKLTILPIPMELMLVVGGTLASKYLHLTDYDVDTIKSIPTGFPLPRTPLFRIMPNLISDAFVIAIVSYSVTVSMALIFAKKEKYKIDFNQELLAMGMGNMFGSWFQCVPFAASLSRSVIQHAVGGKTQIASLVSCSILVFILLFIGPFFEPLPKAVLASIIVVSLKGLLWQFKDLLKFWKLSRMDGIIWLATFTVVVTVAIDVGLMVGVGLSVLCLIVKGLRPYVCLLGNVPGTEIYLDISKYKRAEEIPNLKIFHFAGCLNFASHDHFKKSLYGLIDFEAAANAEKGLKCHPHEIKCVIVDLSCLTYVDASGVKALQAVIEELQNANIEVFLATTECPIFEQLKKFEEHDKAVKFKIFPTIHDAVQFAYHKEIPISVIYESFEF